ncbi:MAG: DUF3520 domain-containing protein, partial [bacterium]|nr:DUF3520 domain-containing protein [bacterium]
KDVYQMDDEIYIKSDVYNDGVSEDPEAEARLRRGGNGGSGPARAAGDPEVLDLTGDNLDRINKERANANAAAAAGGSRRNGAQAEARDPNVNENLTPQENNTIADGIEPVDLTTSGNKGKLQPVPAYTYSYPDPNHGSSLLESDEYIQLYRRRFRSPLHSPRSRFKVRVGTTSYPKVRRSLKKKELPEADKVKIEEMVNYFSYNYPYPTDGELFTITTEINKCPWAPTHRLLHIGLQCKVVTGDGIKDSMLKIAEEVRIQVDFNPAYVKGYRLIGYANKRPKLAMMKPGDQLKGELTAGQSVTTLYEVIPLPRKKEESEVQAEENKKMETATVLVHYKLPFKVEAKLFSHKVWDPLVPEAPSENFKFSAAVAQFGMVLKNPEHKDESVVSTILKAASDAVGKDRYGYRAQFLKLLAMYEEAKKAPPKKDQ